MTREAIQDDEPSGNIFAHLPTIVRQRKHWVIIPTILCFIAGIGAAYLLPTLYRSSATLLVESPQLPDDIAGSQDLDIIDQRIAKIRQQVLSRPRLIELIQKHRLYTDKRDRSSLSEIVEEMRSATSIDAVSAQLQQVGNGKSSTVAFSLSFNYEAAAQAQAVAQDMTEQVLLLDATRNSEQATNTVQFLTEQATAIQTQISALETSIEQVKAANGMALSSNAMSVFGLQTGGYDAQIAALQRENIQLNALKEAKKSSAERDPLVANAEAELAGAQARYSENHPDIAIARRRLSEARRLAANNLSKLPQDTFDQQIASNNAQVAALQAAKSQESSRAMAIQGAQARAPLVMEEIAQKQQRLDAFNKQYEDVSTRLMSAQSGAKAETEQKGERLSVIDPPVVPEDPISPNRPILIAGGLALGLGLGLVLILLMEIIQRPIRDALDIQSVSGASPLVTIPTIPDDSDAPVNWFKRITAFATGFRRKRSTNIAED